MMRVNKKTRTLLFMVVLISIFSLVYETTTALASFAKPNCPEKCGNLTVPYPFGIGDDCSLNEEFNISCNATTNMTRLSWFDYEVYRIENDSVGVVRVTIHLDYNKSSGQSFYEGPQGYDWLGKSYRYSSTKNKFMAVGCDIFAYIRDWKTNELITGCPALCNDSSYLSSMVSSSSNSSSCPGNGCCEASLSRDLSTPMYWVHTMNTKPRSWASGQCSITSVVEKGFSDYSMFNLSSCETAYNVPIVLDWAIGNMSCRDAAVNGSSNYACGRNSKCVDSDRGFGYRCKCLSGYYGNPYLLDGCQDIDECNSPHENNKCPKETVCVNTPGSYFCNCQSGYHSDSTNPKRPVCLPDRGRKTMVMFVSLGVGLTVGIFILVASCLWLHKRMKKRAKDKTKKLLFKRNGGLLLQQKMSSANGNNNNHVLEARVFMSEELEKATDNFNENRILGKGGLGTVYKGMLTDGSIVAVKKSNKMDDEHQVSQFINEVLILSQISHRHIVKLLGCCLETEVPLLVYEYVSNGTLTNHLHKRTDNNINAQRISWQNRLRIAAEVAGALAYLHSYAFTSIFHRDIKSSNILLDENYRAVVSDFGLSRSVSIDRTHLTTVVGGTFGYLDPEYFCTGQLNDKSDVYAFGVILAELVTGKKAVPSKGGEGLVYQFQSSIKENRLFEIVDRAVWDEEEAKEEIVSVANVAFRCLKRCARRRPCMKEVAAELEQVRRLREGGSTLSPEINLQNYNYSSSCERSYTCTVDMVTEEDSEEFIN